jgi:DNA-binding LytR/AlgR family response regulator
MKLKCIVVEDEKIAREGICGYIEQTFFLKLIDSFDNSNSAFEFIKNNHVDILFLDIEMTGMSGMELAKRLVTPAPAVIFTTAYSEYALEGYKVNSIGYLLKPIFFEDFIEVVNKAKVLFKEQIYPVKTYIHVKSEREYIKISTNDIHFIRSLQNYVVIHTDQETIMTLQTLKSISEELPDNFVQTHRSYIVNAKRIERMSGCKIQVGKFQIPISQRMSTESKEKIKRFIV